MKAPSGFPTSLPFYQHLARRSAQSWLEPSSNISRKTHHLHSFKWSHSFRIMALLRPAQHLVKKLGSDKALQDSTVKFWLSVIKVLYYYYFLKCHHILIIWKKKKTIGMLPKCQRQNWFQLSHFTKQPTWKSRSALQYGLLVHFLFHISLFNSLFFFLCMAYQWDSWCSGHSVTWTATWRNALHCTAQGNTACNSTASHIMLQASRKQPSYRTH